MVKQTFEIIAGSYEEFLLGYHYKKDNELVQSFAAHDHTGSLRCVTVCGQYLASGASDDRIFVYDLKTRKEHCSLTHHNATVTCVKFTPNHSHLLSGSADGVLAITRVGNWQLEKVWEKPHKGAAILDIAVHSSGKLALTLGADGTLTTWNLVKGRKAFIINLNSKCKDGRSLEKVILAQDDTHFVLYGGKYTEIWSLEAGGPVQQIAHEERVTSCAWLSSSKVLVGHETGEFTLMDLSGEKRTIQAHKSRVKGVDVLGKRVVSVSSDGEIKVWSLKLEALSNIETGCRLTCLCILPPIHVKEESDVEEEPVEVVQVTPVKKQKARVVVIEEYDDAPPKKRKGKSK